jgi:valyl-tRNA synthetase
MNLIEGVELVSVMESDMLSLADRWILSRLSSVSKEVNRALDEYRFNDAASLLYQFIWHELCDWYVELIKPELYGDNKSAKLTAVSTLVHVYEAALALLHPFMPFVTEEIWQQLPGTKDVESMCIRRYPTAEDGIEDKEAEQKMTLVMDAITGIRSIRGELNISPSVELKALIRTHDSSDSILKENVTYVNTLARTKDIAIGRDVESPKDAATAVKPAMEIFVPLKGLIDIEAEISRLSKDLKKTEDEIAFLDKKLKNKNYVNKAPEAVVQESRAKCDEYKEKLTTIQDNIDKLKKMDASD